MPSTNFPTRNSQSSFIMTIYITLYTTPHTILYNTTHALYRVSFNKLIKQIYLQFNAIFHTYVAE